MAMPEPRPAAQRSPRSTRFSLYAIRGWLSLHGWPPPFPKVFHLNGQLAVISLKARRTMTLTRSLPVRNGCINNWLPPIVEKTFDILSFKKISNIFNVCNMHNNSKKRSRAQNGKFSDNCSEETNNRWIGSNRWMKTFQVSSRRKSKKNEDWERERESGEEGGRRIRRKRSNNFGKEE